MATQNNRDIMKEIKNLEAQVLRYKDLLGEEGRHVADEVRGKSAVAMRMASDKARDAASYARDEANTVASVAREHPAATSTALLAAGLIGGVIGYLLSTPHKADNRWRWY